LEYLGSEEKMSSETITSALFMIAAVTSASILIATILPVIFGMSQTFGAVSDKQDSRLRTDLSIINTFARSSDKTGQIWIKNTGSTRISASEIAGTSVFFGKSDDFEMLIYSGALAAGTWTNESVGEKWDPGETLAINVQSSAGKVWSGGNEMYVSFALPNGVRRSEKFDAV